MTSFRVIPATALLAAGIVSGSIFQNGSFENPGNSPGAFTILQNNDTTITGWVHHAGNAGVGGGQDLYANNLAGVFTAFDGTNAVLFGGTSTTGGSLGQTFDTVAGTTYNFGY